MAKPEPLLPADLDLREYLLALPEPLRRLAVEHVGPANWETLDAAWAQWAHAGQLAPPGRWSTWVIQAGRGFGKTRAGAEWLAALVDAHEGVALRIALVGASLEEARKVMVEGRSGLVEVAAGAIRDWEPCRGRLTFRSGAVAQLCSGASPDLLRGPEHHFAWCDELAKWDKAQETWDMLQLGLRLAPSPGAGPQALVTTTPRSGPVLRAIVDDPATVVTGGPTRANPHLPRVWQQRVERLYAGTRLGRQELDGEILPDAAGALWTVELLEKCRTGPLRQPASPSATSPVNGEGFEEAQQISSPARGGGGREAAGGGWADTPSGGPLFFTRTLIAVDPPTGDGTCGIIAVARAGHGAEATAHILADHSVTARSPEGWASAVAAAAEAHATIEVVAEQNQGGKMVKAILHAADPRLRIKLVSAHTGKSARAEPVAHLFEAGRAWIHGKMPELEAQLLGMIAGGGYEGPGGPKASPDRADAMVWGVSELMKERAEPRVRVV
ncbi:MAG TPA: terminase family protein [Croceibacterium sp.]